MLARDMNRFSSKFSQIDELQLEKIHLKYQKISTHLTELKRKYFYTCYFFIWLQRSKKKLL